MAVFSECKQISLTASSPSSASTATGTATSDISLYSKCVIQARLVGATGGTLDVYIQSTNDGGTTWSDVVHFPQLASGASAVGYSATLQRGGTATVPIVVNTANGTPVLAANVVTPYALGTQLRVVFVAGGGTSAGASQTILCLLSTL